MALSIAIDTAYGVSATYHMLGDVRLNRRLRSATLVMEGFTSEQARRGGLAPIHATVIDVPAGGIPVDATDADLYAIVKADPVFAAAEDC